MKKVLIGAALALTSSLVVAGSYVGGSIGYTSYDVPVADENQRAANYTGTYGYIMQNGVGFEGEYRYIDSADITADATIDSSQQFTGYLVGRVPLAVTGTKVNLIGKAGIGYGFSKIKVDKSVTDRTWYPAIALGAEIGITENLDATMFVDYRDYYVSRGGIDSSINPVAYNLGLQYNF